MNDQQTFKAIMVALSEVFPKEITPGLLKTYWLVLASYSDEDVAQAAGTWLHNGKFFPKPSELIELIAGTLDESTQRAWGEVLRQLRDSRSARFNEAVSLAVNALGGVGYLSKLSHRELDFKYREFVKVYKPASERDQRARLEYKVPKLSETGS